MSQAIVVRPCEGLEDFSACVELERLIWGAAEIEVVPLAMFVVASKVGGQVLGAFDGQRMVGFVLALPGVRNGSPYLHSHMTGVVEGYRDRGVGMQLKLLQREEALGRGIRLVESTFDSLELLNAHFHLNKLGAIARQIQPNLYGLTTSPLHRGLPTDRLLAEWHLDSPRVLAAVNGKLPRPEGAPAAIHVPAGIEEGGEKNRAELARVQERVRKEFQDWFSKGYAAIGMEKASQDCRYLLAPWSDF
ncbi:MAG: acetyltransferase [Candidatus Acidiferrales bacterium]|jgi:predicted GNAT superfamily acetyltransferase